MLNPISSNPALNAKNAVPLRLFVLKDDNVEISFNIPVDQWSIAEEVREQFHIIKRSEDTINSSAAASDNQPSEEAQDEKEKEIELFVKFLDFSSSYAYGNASGQGQEVVTQYSEYESVYSPEDSQTILKFISCVFSEFCNRFVKGNNVHVTTSNLSKEVRLHVIRTYYKILDILISTNTNSNGTENDFSEKELARSRKSALFEAVSKHEASLFAIFGGQGSENYFNEILEIFDTYNIYVRSYLERMASVLEELAAKPELLPFFPKGLHIMKWIEEPETLPDSKYMVSAPISLPVVGLCQLLHYRVLYKTLGKTPDEMRRCFNGKE